MSARVYKFGGFTLDCDRFELLRGEQSLKLERKPMELLILLAASNGNLVTREEIAERLWEQEVFVDTEHGINTAVRKIRQALKDTSEQPRFVRTVTGKGYRFIGRIEEQPVPSPVEALVVDVPDRVEAPGKQSLEEIPVAEPDRVHGIRRWVWVSAAVVVMALGIAGWRGWHHGAAPIRSLAVLPLENLTGQPGLEYVSDGMTDELTTMLAKNSTLRITSRTSVMQYKGVHRPLPEIARELGVDAILEGSMSRSGELTHMTIQLIAAPDDTHVWAESYDRDARGLVSLPKEAAQAIAKRLDSGVLQQTPARAVSPEAHDAYLRGRYLWFTDHTQQAAPYFQRATELQPDYALGWSGLAIYYGASLVKGELSPAEAFPGLEASTARALTLDPTLPEAHLAAAGMEMAAHWDLVRADAEITRALELDPKFAEAYHLRSKILAAQGRQGEAIEAQQKATELDPFTRPWALALSLVEARQFDRALEEARERLVVYPDNSILVWLLHVIYEDKGMQRESAEALAKSLEIDGKKDRAEGVRKAFAGGGYPALLRWKRDRAKERAKSRYVSPVDLAALAAKLGEREEALSLLEEGYRQRATRMLWIQDDPAFDALHGESRYRSIVQRMGLPAKY